MAAVYVAVMLLDVQVEHALARAAHAAAAAPGGISDVGKHPDHSNCTQHQRLPPLLLKAARCLEAMMRGGREAVKVFT